MSEYLDANDTDRARTGNDKECTRSLTTRTLGMRAFRSISLFSPYLLGSRGSDQLQHDAFHYFNLGSLRNLSVSLTGYRSNMIKVPTKVFICP